MHDFSIAGINQDAASIMEGLGTDLEGDGSGQVTTVARQRRNEMPRHVVVDTPHVAFKF